MDTEMSPKESFSLDRLLAWLDGDRSEAGRKYVRFQKEMIAYAGQHGGATVAEESTDEAFDRIDKKLSSALFSEHFNSAEIRDVPGLCFQIYDEAAKNQPSPSRRIWQILSEAARLLVASIAETGKYEKNQRTSLSQALNVTLQRRDFYNAEDFNTSKFLATGSDNSLVERIEKIKTDLARGLSRLLQSEIERFNRCLLEAAYPSKITPNLADTPEQEKLARCKRYVRMIALERIKKLQNQVSLDNPSKDTKEDLQIADVKDKDQLEGLIEKEEAKKREQRLKCIEECVEKLPPRDRVIFNKYFGGIEMFEDKSLLENRKMKDFRKELAREYDVPDATIRTWARRVRITVTDCAEKCMKWLKKN